MAEIKDRYGEWDECRRCGYRAQITRSSAYGGFLALQFDGFIICWNGRECSLRLRRRRRTT